MMSGFRADLLEEEDRRTRDRARAWKLGVGATVLALFLGVWGVWTWLFAGMPRIPDKDALWVVNRAPAIEFTDAEGRTLAVRGPRYGRAVDARTLPPHVVRAFLAIEDARFYEHPGIDARAIGRALVENIEAGRTVQGGSTITQQIVKTIFLSPEQTYRRKVQEMRLAWEIERLLSKDEILSLYLNRIYFGANAYGVDAASRRYFGKSAADLTLGEAALLAGLPKAPSRLDPIGDPKAAEARMAVVLGAMVAAGFITPAQQAAALAEPPALAPPLNPEGELAYVFDAAAERVRTIAPNAPPDLVVQLTVDPKLQAAAVTAVRSGVGRSRVGQGALVALDREGAILALVGGTNYASSQFNRATQARRQPGSTFKPFVYAAALEAGMKPSTVRVDRPVNYAGWRPANFGGGYSGAMTLEQALVASVNTIPAQLAAEVKIETVAELAARLGVATPVKRNLSSALGASETTLLDLTTGYATLAAEGRRASPELFNRIETSRGELVYERPRARGAPVYDAAKAREMIEMMRQVVVAGTGRRAALPGREAAGKTGTSQNFRDAWFVGFTTDITAGVWVGNDDFAPMDGVTGGRLPAEIWRSFMIAAHEGLPARDLPRPSSAFEGPTPEAMAAFYRDLARQFAVAAGDPPTAPAPVMAQTAPSPGRTAQ